MSRATGKRVQAGDAAVTQLLGEWVASVEYKSLAAEHQLTVQGLILDFVRVTGIGARTSWGADIRDVVSQLGGAGRSTTLIFGDRLDPARAAYINGSLAHCADTDDTHVGAMLHPGAVVIPAALAVAEEVGADGPTTIAAIVAGYEVAIRIALAVQPSHFHRGFQATATCGVFGAAAAACRVLQLSGTEIAGAFGIAGSSAAGLAQFYYSGSLVKRLHAGMAAQSGVMAALFARAGITGPRDVLEGVAGFAHAYADEFKPAEILSSLGQHYKLPEITIKGHATSARLQAAVEAAVALGAEDGLAPSDIDLIEVAIPRIIHGRLTQPDPPDVSAAQLSLPFSAALAITVGHERGTDFLTVADYEARLDDSEVRRLARSCVCTVDAAIDAMTTEEVVPAKVTARLVKGRDITRYVSRPVGAPGRPLDRADHERLVASGLTGLVSDSAVRGVIEAVEHLGSAASVDGITRPLAGASGSTAVRRHPRFGASTLEGGARAQG